MKKLIQVTTTFGNREEAVKATDLLLSGKLAACIQLVDSVESKFWWEGKVDKAEETLLLIKTTMDNFDKVRQLIKECSSYELPEIIATPIVAGDEEYLDWFKKNLNENNSK